MSDKDTSPDAVRERLSDAIGNGQIHPALADYLALVDDEIRGAHARHQALVDDLNQPAAPEPPADDEKPADEKPPARKATPGTVADKGSTR